MKLYKIILSGAFKCGMILLSSCSSFVQVEPPQSRLLSKQVFDEVGTLDAALAGMYGDLRDASNGILYLGSMSMSQYVAFSADELVSYTTTSTTHGPNFFDNTIYPDSPDILALWNATYKSIYYANAIIEGIDNSVNLAQASRSMGTGEALFVRALLHFYLTNMFGAVPYVYSTDYRINGTLSKLSTDHVLASVVEDLLKAEKLLEDNYPTAERIRANKSVVRALLARVYLYQGQWALAEAKASEVIANTSMFKWVDDLSKLFLKESTEIIWAFKPKIAGLNSGAALLYRLTPTTLYFSLSMDFMNAFEGGDVRREKWTGSVNNAAGTYYYPYKYKATAATSPTDVEYLQVFRLSEQYLIRAEAYAQQDKIDESKADLNKIRRRASLGDTPASTKEALLDAILRERRIELFSEFGHRWFDLKRTGKTDAILKKIKPHWEPTDVLFPIPEKELLANPNLLPQNPGYTF